MFPLFPLLPVLLIAGVGVIVIRTIQKDRRQNAAQIARFEAKSYDRAAEAEEAANRG